LLLIIHSLHVLIYSKIFSYFFRHPGHAQIVNQTVNPTVLTKLQFY